MTALYEPQALPDLIAGYRLICAMLARGDLSASDFALRVDAMRAKAHRLGLGGEFREGCAEVDAEANCAT